METYKDFLNCIDSDKLSPTEKNALRKLGSNSKLLDKALQKIKNQLSNKILTEELSTEFVKGALHTLWYVRGMTK